MDWDDLRYFLALAHTGALAGAARELGCEHTTVGRRLTALEGALGARLFTRGPRGLSLTRAGREILGSAQRIADGVRDIERRVAGLDARAVGAVARAAAVGFGLAPLPCFFARDAAIWSGVGGPVHGEC